MPRPILPDAIKEACANGDMQAIEAYLTTVDGAQHEPILHEMADIAIGSFQNEVFHFCLRGGAIPSSSLGSTAIYKRNLPAYKTLLAAGLDIKEHYGFGGDALMCTVQSSNISFATFLLDNGAEVQNPLAFGSPEDPRLKHCRYCHLGFAAFISSPEMIALLLSQGPTLANTLALHNAAGMDNRFGAMQQFLDAGADINEIPETDYHNTWEQEDRLAPPLFYAVDARQMESVIFLLDHGADPTLLDRAGRNILERMADTRLLPYGQSPEWPELIELLRERNISTC